MSYGSCAVGKFKFLGFPKGQQVTTYTRHSGRGGRAGVPLHYPSGETYGLVVIVPSVHVREVLQEAKIQPLIGSPKLKFWRALSWASGDGVVNVVTSNHAEHRAVPAKMSDKGGYESLRPGILNKQSQQSVYDYEQMGPFSCIVHKGTSLRSPDIA